MTTTLITGANKGLGYETARRLIAAGAWGPPVRVGAPSDITVVELASKQT
ncbi:hypothetical protein ABZ613_19325 [Streptomyces collinus]